jgi:L,D-peptidoglycan transpeptidase YkuD (ErfK/YbiS/YcfS/YnhG family)
MDIQVFADNRLLWRDRTYRCALGRSGVRTNKSEGDGATPVGCYTLRRVMYRADRLAKPKTRLPVAPLTPIDGWCDDPEHSRYNQPVVRPFDPSHETLWRNDNLYDLIVILGHNDDPPVPGAGSAIFLHVARPDYGPTEGCVALAAADLLEVLTDCGPGDRIRILNPADVLRK